MEERSMLKATYGNPPQVGDILLVHGFHCEVIRVYDFGTIDVTDGTYSYRVTGLVWGKLVVEDAQQ